MKQYLNSKEAAVYTGYSERTLRTWRHEGKGPPYHKPRTKVLYDVDELNKWIKESTDDNQENHQEN